MHLYTIVANCVNSIELMLGKLSYIILSSWPRSRGIQSYILSIPGHRLQIFEFPAGNSKLYMRNCTWLYIYDRIRLYAILYNCLQM